MAAGLACRRAQSSYDVVIIGGGGHGLATAYYLAANHGITQRRGARASLHGSGNVGRNTTIVRSNYVLDGNTQFFEYSLKLWEGLSQELNFNVMLSQRGQIVLAHPAQLDVLARKGNIMRLNGIDAELLDRGRGDAPAAVPRLFRRGALSDLGWPLADGAPVPRATMRWRGDMPARPMPGRRHHRELRSARAS